MRKRCLDWLSKIGPLICYSPSKNCWYCKDEFTHAQNLTWNVHLMHYNRQTIELKKEYCILRGRYKWGGLQQKVYLSRKVAIIKQFQFITGLCLVWRYKQSILSRNDADLEKVHWNNNNNNNNKTYFLALLYLICASMVRPIYCYL